LLVLLFLLLFALSALFAPFAGGAHVKPWEQEQFRERPPGVRRPRGTLGSERGLRESSTRKGVFDVGVAAAAVALGSAADFCTPSPRRDPDELIRTLGGGDQNWF